LARGNSKQDCLKAVKRMQGNGWVPISKMKLDDSLAYTGGDVSYVVVMESKEKDSLNKAHRWNNNLPIIK
jgi:hypothetical protein